MVVPSYNHAGFVAKTLLSIIKQTLPPRELIVIDDGSKDGSPQVIERVLKDCPFPCELITRPNRGLCQTLNEGLGRSRGDYFAYLSSDDIWLPRFLEARVHLLESKPKAVVGYGHAYHIDKDDRIIKSTSDWANFVDGNVQGMLLASLIPFSSSVVYRRPVLEKYGWNEAARLEDYELYLHLSAEGDFAFDPQILSAWREHGSNTSRDSVLMFEECLTAQRRAAAHLNLSPSRLDILQADLKLKYAKFLAKRGYKSESVRLLRLHAGAYFSHVSEVGSTLVWLMIPQVVLRQMRKLSQRLAHRRYGSVNV